MAKGKKGKLILGQEIESNEQMTFDDNSRPDPSVTDKLANRETPFDKVDFPQPDENHRSYEELLASDEYRTALNRLAFFAGQTNIGTGIRGPYARLSMQASHILEELKSAESNHIEELEQLCERVIRDYFKIPENALQFNFKLQSESIQINPEPEEGELEQQEEELTDDVNALTQERAKRRLINAMTQGHAVDGTWIFRNIIPELQRITGVENIAEKYSIFISTMMLGYWQFPQEMISESLKQGGQIEEAQGAGKTQIDTSTNPPTVHATAVIFPFLIHEAIKGVMEFLGKQRKIKNPQLHKKAMELEDTIQHEVWDIRLGPAIWRRLVNLFPDAIKNEESKKKLQYYIYSNIVNLEAKELLILMKEVMGETETGRKLIGAIYYDLSRKVDDETVTKSESEFRKLMDELAPKVPDDEITDLLSSLGISLS